MTVCEAGLASNQRLVFAELFVIDQLDVVSLMLPHQQVINTALFPDLSPLPAGWHCPFSMNHASLAPTRKTGVTWLP